MKSPLRYTPALLSLLAAVPLSSCLRENKGTDYTEWQEANTKYVTEAESAIDEKTGLPEYTRITPVWAPTAWSLIKWHNDRSLNADALSPRDNSTVAVKYALYDISGNMVDNSYSKTDSLYVTRPCNNVVGFWNALTEMRVGDVTTVVIPYTAGYGSTGSSAVPPFSTLVFDIELREITGFDTPY